MIRRGGGNELTCRATVQHIIIQAHAHDPATRTPVMPQTIPWPEELGAIGAGPRYALLLHAGASGRAGTGHHADLTQALHITRRVRVPGLAFAVGLAVTKNRPKGRFDEAGFGVHLFFGVDRACALLVGHRRA